jgi:hypothetical protein
VLLGDVHLNLEQTLLSFDAYLDRQNLENLTLEEAAFILMRIDLFHQYVADAFGCQSQKASELAEQLCNWASGHPHYPEGATNIEFLFESSSSALGHKPHNHYLMAVGCRLASDLNEKIVTRLSDLLDRREKNLEDLYKSVRKTVQEQQIAAKLLDRAQKNRELTVENGLALGLGMLV